MNFCIGIVLEYLRDMFLNPIRSDIG
jgi:hypothetical protein